MKYRNAEKEVEFTKISIKMKNCKTFYETKTAVRIKEIIQPPDLTTSPEQSLLGIYSDI